MEYEKGMHAVGNGVNLLNQGAYVIQRRKQTDLAAGDHVQMLSRFSERHDRTPGRKVHFLHRLRELRQQIRRRGTCSTQAATGASKTVNWGVIMTTGLATCFGGILGGHRDCRHYIYKKKTTTTSKPSKPP